MRYILEFQLCCCCFVFRELHAFHMSRQQFLICISGAAFHLVYCVFYCFALLYGNWQTWCVNICTATVISLPLTMPVWTFSQMRLTMQKSAIFAWPFQSAPLLLASEISIKITGCVLLSDRVSETIHRMACLNFINFKQNSLHNTSCDRPIKQMG